MVSRLFFVASLLGACGGPSGNGPADMAQPPDLSTVYPAPHAMPPQELTLGGPILDTPKLIPVFFANDNASEVTQLADFTAKVGGTSYFAAATHEYGVGKVTAAAPIHLTES